MDDDDLLKALANAARADEEELDDPRWDRLARGELDERDRAALAEGADRSEVAARALVTFEPLDAAAKRRIEDAVLGVIAGARPSEADADAAKRKLRAGWERVAGSGGPSSARRPPGRTQPTDGPVSSSVPAPSSRSPRSSRPRVAFTTLLLAAALGAGLLVVGRQLGDRASQVPLYAMEIVGGDQAERGAAAPSELPPHLAAGSRIEITLRPASRSEGPIAARAFLAREGRVRPWDAPIEMGEGGAARVKGTRETLFAGVDDGPWEVLFAVGPAGTLPGAETVEAAMHADRAPEGFRLLRRDVILGAVPAPGASGGKGKP